MAATIELQVSHRTITRYTSRVEVAYHCAFLHPRDGGRQKVRDFTLAIDPLPSHPRERAGLVRQSAHRVRAVCAA